MPIHTVTQGECLSSIAKKYGFAQWKTLYDHPENAELKKQRKNPSLLLPGDGVWIPEKEQKEVECAAGQKHRFTVKSPKALFRVVLKDGSGEHYGNKKYELTVGDRTWKGTTDGKGLVEQKIEQDAAEAQLVVWLDDKTSHAWTLRLGHLDPAETVSGAQARLRNLGYDAGPIDGQPGPKLEAALRAFQKKNGLSETGTLDDATKDKIRAAHDAK